MLATALLAIMLAQTSGYQSGSPSQQCSGADPAVVSAGIQNVAHDATVNRYTIAITVVNRGSAKQPSNLLQSLAIYQDATKVGQKGVPPLKPGQSYTLTYVFVRSNEAVAGSTRLRFTLVLQNYPQPGSQDCNPGNDRVTIRA